MSEAVGDYVAESAAQACCATTAVVDAIHDGIGSVRTAVKRGGDAAEELLNDTTKRIQRHPVLTVAATFAVGLTAGAFIGWFMKRK